MELLVPLLFAGVKGVPVYWLDWDFTYIAQLELHFDN